MGRGVRPVRRFLNLPQIEELKEGNPETYQALATMARHFNALAGDVFSVLPDKSKPTGPRNVVAKQLGGKIQISWEQDTSVASVARYRIIRATAGTRSSPTTPLVTAGAQIKEVPSGDNCGSVYKWTDEDFDIADYKVDNPSRFSYWVRSVMESGTTVVSEPQLASGCPIELLPSGMGEISPNPKVTSPNKLLNASFVTDVTSATKTLRTLFGISSTTNASPIEVTTTANHGASTGERVAIVRCTNTNANGVWPIVVTGLNKFTITGSSAGGTAGGGEAIFNYPTQTDPPATRCSDGTPAWTYWQDISNDATAKAQFPSDGVSHATGEVFLPSPTATTKVTEIGQEIAISRFTGGEHYTFSVFIRLAPGTSPAAGSSVTVSIDDLSGNNFGFGTFDGSLLTTSYQRFAGTIVMGDLSGYNDFDGVLVKVVNTRVGAAGNDLYLRWPMLNTGDFPAIWSDTPDPSSGVGSYSSAVIASSTPSYARAPDGHLVTTTYA